MDPISNFGTYRGALDKAIGQADASKDGPHSWVVPFFSLIVKDIYFMHEGMSGRDVNGYIRFEKCMSLARLVSQILSYKDRVVSTSVSVGVYIAAMGIDTEGVSPCRVARLI